MDQPKPTVFDVARLAGVSKSTVSLDAHNIEVTKIAREQWFTAMCTHSRPLRPLRPSG